jgi:hypothetical protein
MRRAPGRYYKHPKQLHSLLRCRRARNAALVRIGQGRIRRCKLRNPHRHHAVAGIFHMTLYGAKGAI